MKIFGRKIQFRLTIRRTLILYTSGIMAVSGAFIILISYLNSEKIIISIASAVLRISTDRVEQKLSELAVTCDSVIMYSSIAMDEGYINTVSPDSERRLWKHFLSIPGKYIDAVYIADPAGNFTGIDRKSPDSEPFIGRSGRSTSGRMMYFRINPDGSRGAVSDRRSERFDPRTRPWYTDAERRGAPVWTAPYRDWISGRLTITLSRPVYSSGGRIRGVCGVDVFLESIEKFLKQIDTGLNGIVFITGGSGELIASSAGVASFTADPVSGENSITSAADCGNPVIAMTYMELLRMKESGSSDGNAAAYRFSHGFENYAAGFKKFNEKNGLDWNIYIVVREVDFLGRLRNTLRIAILLTVIIIAAALALTYRMSERLTRPLKVLSRAALNIARDRKSSPVPEDGPAELALLAKSFNRMSSDLNYTIQHLEDLVEQRTSELSGALSKEKDFNELNRLLVSNITGGDMESVITGRLARLVNADICEIAVPGDTAGEFRYYVYYQGKIQSYRVEDADEMPVQMRFSLQGYDISDGYIFFARTNEADRFTGSERIFAESVCSMAGIAIENRRLFAAISRIADTDSLTGINNRQHVESLAAHAFANAARYRQELSVIMFDIDDFKKVNDTYGHDAGDIILKTVASTAWNGLRSSDILGRFGGEEFLVILPSTAKAPAMEIAARIRSDIEMTMVDYGNTQIHVTVSLGVAAMIHDSDRSVEEIIKRADIAMYEAKNAGKNRVSFFRKP